MFGLGKNPKEKPTTFFLLSLCLHLIAFVGVCLGMFTPYWATVTEQIGTSSSDFTFERGLVVSCGNIGKSGCTSTNDLSNFSSFFMAAFILGIGTMVIAFLSLQTFVLGACLSSCKTLNLAIPLAAISILQGTLFMLTLVFFEISLTRDTSTGNIHRESSFGFSRGLIIGAIVLYFLSSFFLTGEYFRRLKASSFPSDMELEDTRPRPQPRTRRGSPPQDFRSQEPDPHKSRDLPPMVVLTQTAVGPPPSYRPSSDTGFTNHYTSKNNNVNSNSNTLSTYSNNDSNKNRIHYSSGMKPCRIIDCAICEHVMETPTFWGPAGVFAIREKLDCNTNNVVYAVLCRKDDVVFIGNSKPSLEITFSNHLNNIKAWTKTDPVAVHFNQDGHSIDDARVVALASLDCDKDTRSRLEYALSYDMYRPRQSYYGINRNFRFL